jgi:hypothetical protein
MMGLPDEWTTRVTAEVNPLMSYVEDIDRDFFCFSLTLDEKYFISTPSGIWQRESPKILYLMELTIVVFPEWLGPKITFKPTSKVARSFCGKVSTLSIFKLFICGRLNLAGVNRSP